MGRKSIVAWVVALALLVSIALRITRTAEPERAEPVSPSESERAEPVGASSPAPSRAPDASAGSTGSAAASDGRSELAQPLTDPVVIAVIDSATGAPVPGALVRTLDARALAGGPMDFEQDAFHEAQLLEHGTRWIADELGEVRIERFAFSGRISAEKDGAWGSREIDSRDSKAERWEVAIAADRPLVVRVLGPERRPIAGVPVRLRCYDGLGSLDDPTLTAISDADGRAVLRHASTFFARRAAKRWLVHVLAVLDPPVFVDVDASSFEHELELVLPPTGSVELSVLDFEGRLAARPTHAWLSAVARGFGDDAIVVETLSRVQGLTDGGRILFPWVALGLELEAFSAMPEPPLGNYLRRAAGPTHVGEVVVIELGGPGEAFALAGRVLGPDGAPLGAGTIGVGLEIRRDGSMVQSGGAPHELDSDGRFRIVLPANVARGVQRKFTLRTFRGGAAESSGSFQFDSDLEAPITQVGDVRLAPLSLVVAGRVVDELGLPIGPVQVFPCAARDATRGPGLAGWAKLGALMRPSERDGTFQVRADDALGAQGVWVEGSGFLQAEVVPFELGAAEVVVRVTRTATVSGTIRFDAGFEARDFDAVLVSAADERAWLRVPLASQHDTTRAAFRFDPVPSGVHELRIRVGEEVVARIVGVDVRFGGPPDPRLAEIDVRGTVRAFELCVLDDARKPLDWGSVTVRAGGDGAHWRSRTLAFGCARVLTTSASLDVAIELPGFRPVFEPHVTGAREFVLQRGIAVEVELEHPPLPDDALLRVILRSTEPAPDGYPVGWPLSTSTRAQRESRFELVAQAPGRYTVAVEFQLGGAAGSVPMFDVTPEPLEIRDVDGQRFRVALDPAVVAEKLAYLERQR
ncbi:MAG: hypothetical protein IT453_15080 [Planctomycetes bacterium]|nr:hypothetical protein [Planctomycetota bacterium]